MVRKGKCLGTLKEPGSEPKKTGGGRGLLFECAIPF